MANPRTIRLAGSGTDTQQYELAPGLAQYVQAVYVEVDNTAGGDARPLLTLSEQSGVVIAKKRQGEAIAAGDTGTATWALRLDDEGGGGGTDLDDVLFNDPNTETDPRYLDIPVNQAGPSGYRFNLEGQSLRVHATHGALPTGFILLDVDTSNTALTLTQGTASLNGYQHAFLSSDTGNTGVSASGGDVKISATQLARAVRIRTQAGTDVIVALDEKVGFFAATPVARQNITGSRGGNAALASLLTGLANLGLITDSTTA